MGKNFQNPYFRFKIYCGSLELSYSYVPLPYEACSPNKLAAPPAAAAPPPVFLESGARTKKLKDFRFLGHFLRFLGP